MTQESEKKQRGLTLLIESLHKPDTKLRSCAHNQDCFEELMFYRQEIIDHCHQKLKELQDE
ncbi:MAG: hypothetical protein CMK23_04480 [Porticoccaceae bacterium]|nr:hypothetical protein [Porticoccaceae bacterium]